MGDVSEHEGCAYGYIFFHKAQYNSSYSLASLTLNSVQDVLNYDDTIPQLIYLDSDYSLLLESDLSEHSLFPS